MVAETLNEAPNLGFEQPEVVYCGIYNPEAVFPKRKEWPDLKLFEAPIHVAKTELGDGVTNYDAIFDHPPLYGETLMNFLKTVSPDGDKDEIFGVISDWELPELKYDSDRLRRHEKGLGEHWTDFMASRELFMNALTSGLQEHRQEVLRRGQVVDTRERQINLLQWGDLADRFSKLWRRMDFYEGRRVYRGPELPNFISTVVGYMRDDGLIDDRDASRMMEGKTRKAVARIFREQSNKYAKKYYLELTQEQRRAALDRYVDERYEQIEIDGSTVYFGSGFGASAEQLLEAYNRRESRQVRGGLYFVDTAMLQKPKGAVRIVFPHTLRPGNMFASIQPVMSWQSTVLPDGKVTRELLVNGHGQEELTRPDKSIYGNVIAGLLCVAYLQPSIRDRWKKSLGLVGEAKTQEMGAAQVPVVALQHRNQLLASKLISDLEQFAA